MMINLHRHDRRGFGMLGLMALIALMAFLCAAVSISSSRSVAGSVRGMQRLQALAAAEGAAVMLASGYDETSGTVHIGDCRVMITPGSATADALTTPSAYQLKVEIPAGERIAYTRSFRTAAAPGTSHVVLEPLP